MPELTANGRPVPGGFAGTLSAFLEWLGEQLAYGGVGIGEPVADPIRPHRRIRQVRLVTGGYSDDEALLGRVRRSMFALQFWESDHRGGLSTYHVPVDAFDSEDEVQWLDEPTDVFEEVWRARTLVVEVEGRKLSLDLPHGARLRFAEPDRDICAPAGLLTVEGIPAEEADALFGRAAPPEHDQDTAAELLEELLGTDHDD